MCPARCMRLSRTCIMAGASVANGVAGRGAVLRLDFISSVSVGTARSIRIETFDLKTRRPNYGGMTSVPDAQSGAPQGSMAAASRPGTCGPAATDEVRPESNRCSRSMPVARPIVTWFARRCVGQITSNNGRLGSGKSALNLRLLHRRLHFLHAGLEHLRHVALPVLFIKQFQRQCG